MLEHAWAPVTNWLSQLVTSDKLPGKYLPPLQQKLFPVQLFEKEVKLLDIAASQIKGCLTVGSLDGHPVACEPMPAGSEDSYGDEDVINCFSRAAKREIMLS